MVLADVEGSRDASCHSLKHMVMVPALVNIFQDFWAAIDGYVLENLFLGKEAKYILFLYTQENLKYWYQAWD